MSSATEIVIDPHEPDVIWRVRGGRVESCYNGTWVFARAFEPTPERIRMWMKLLIRDAHLSGAA